MNKYYIIEDNPLKVMEIKENLFYNFGFLCILCSDGVFRKVINDKNTFSNIIRINGNIYNFYQFNLIFFRNIYFVNNNDSKDFNVFDLKNDKMLYTEISLNDLLKIHNVLERQYKIENIICEHY
jgi:hypothetical protein